MIDAAVARAFIEANSIPVPFCGCRLWLGRVGTHGYGIVGNHGLAHRVSFEAHHGPIPWLKYVLHSCDTKLCVEGSHLSAGDARQNAAEASRRGLIAKKLTPDLVRAIRAAHVGGAAIRALARAHDVSQKCVQMVVRRETWAHV